MRKTLILCGLLAFSAPLLGQPAGAIDARLAARRTPVVAVFEQCKDAVVNIASTQVVKYQSSLGFGDLFGDMFQSPSRMREQRVTSVGSGFVFHPSGYIVTNAHVVAQTAERKVIFADGSEFEAKIVALDEQRDLAVLKIEANRPLPTIKLGASADLMVGETVIAIGYAMGYKHTVTAGVVSALDREIKVTETVKFTGLIQTDASINPGNSGGPLLNVLGELIGINTAIRGDAQNIGFAIPVDHLRATLPELLDIERRYRIVVGMHVSPDIKRRVVAVDSGSPAALAGVQIGDVIEAIDGNPVITGLDYQVAMLGRKAGDSVRVRITHESGAVIDTIVQLIGRPRPDGAKLIRDRLGVASTPLTAEAAQQLHLSRNIEGLVIVSVDGHSVADEAGLRRGDVILAIGRYQLSNLDEAGELLENVRRGDSITVDVLRPARGNVILRQRVTLVAQ